MENVLKCKMYFSGAFTTASIRGPNCSLSNHQVLTEKPNHTHTYIKRLSKIQILRNIIGIYLVNTE